MTQNEENILFDLKLLSRTLSSIETICEFSELSNSFRVYVYGVIRSDINKIDSTAQRKKLEYQILPNHIRNNENAHFGIYILFSERWKANVNLS